MQDENNQLVDTGKIGDHIRAARKARGLTQERLGALIGVAKASIARWETTTRNPGGHTLVALAKALKVPLDWLIAGSGPPPADSEERLAQLVRDRRARLKQILEGQPDLDDFAERCSVNALYLEVAKKEWNDSLTLDEALRIAHAAKKSPTWLLFGEKEGNILFAPDLTNNYLSPVHRECLLENDPVYGQAPAHETSSNEASAERQARLQQILKAQMDLKALATKAEVSEMSIREFLNGKRTLNLDQVARIAIETGISLKWLLFGDQSLDNTFY